MVVDIFIALNPFKFQRTWFEGTATHSDDNCFSQVTSFRSCDGKFFLFVNLKNRFIEMNRGIKSI
ncbi:Uncharacterised protein [Mycobacterium tuberculosis]|nr:Uncharacterised protein [Mycobacterium tuberculosis]